MISQKESAPQSPLRRGSLQSLFHSLNIPSSKSAVNRKLKPLPPTPADAEFLGSFVFPKDLSLSAKEIGKSSLPVIQDSKPDLVKRICLPDEKSVMILSSLFGSSSSWSKLERVDRQGLKETVFYNRNIKSHLRGCCINSKNIISCCSLCDHQNWTFQGSQYDPCITELYSQNDGCIPSHVKLINPKFIIPWRYKNRKSGAISWKIIHMCGATMEDAECETIVVNVERDRRLAKVLETVKSEGKWYNGADKVEYLLKVVRLVLGDYGLPGGATSSTADASLYAQMKEQGHNFMMLCSVKVGLCRHKALLFKILCDISGLECSLITGYSTGGRHQWNIVALYDESKCKMTEYIIDPTSPHFTWTKKGSARMKAYKINPLDSFGHGGMTLMGRMNAVN